jgi:hypothetical protein
MSDGQFPALRERGWPQMVAAKVVKDQIHRERRLAAGSSDTIFKIMQRKSSAPSVQPGYVNRNGQTVIGGTDKQGTDHGNAFIQ